MKRNLTKIVMLVLTLCVMVAMFAVVASAAAKEDIGLVAVTKSSVTYNRDGNSATTAKQQAPTVVVYDNDGVTKLVKDTDFSLDVVTYTQPDGTVAYKNVKFADAEFKYAGTYTITVKGIGANYKGTKTVVYQITKNTNNTVENNFKNWVGSVYGETVANATAKSKFGTGTVRYYTKADYEAGNLENGTKDRPTLPGDYVIRFYTPATINYAAAEKVEYITIEKREITLNIVEATKTYGAPNSADLYKFEYAAGSLEFLAADVDGIVMTPGYVGEEMVGYQYGALTAVVEHPYYDVTVNAGDIYIAPRLIEFKDNYVLQYNGKMQLPTVEILNLVGDDECFVEVIGSSRKYGGTYTIKVVAITNDNYTLGDGVNEVVLTYTIEAEGLLDHDNALGEFVEGVVNAGQVAGDVAEVVTPVFNYIGNAIWNGFKNGVSALVTDFFGRVFG